MELLVVSVFVVIAMAILIFKGAQLVISIMNPFPSVSELKWRQNPKLPEAEHPHHQNKTSSASAKMKPKEPKGKRPPRAVRIEQLYSSSPLPFEELDSSFGRRSGASTYHQSQRSMRPQSRHDEMMLNTSVTHEKLPQGIPLEQISFVEDDLDDPIEAYVQEQHRRMLQEHPNRASTPIQSNTGQRQYSKSHATLV